MMTNTTSCQTGPRCPPLAVTTAVLMLVILMLIPSATSFGQIQPYEQNHWYWQYNGKPLLLFGGSDRDNIFQWAGQGTRLTDHLDLLAGCGGNYVRCTMSSREYTEAGHRWDLLPYPFAKVNGKYDVRKWDESYWQKLRTFLAETKTRGIIVQLEFWDRWNESGDSNKPTFGWYWSPWNPNNNINYDWEDSPLLHPGKTGFYNSFHAAAATNDPVLPPWQERFVKKVLDEVIDGGFDNVLFQVDNESGFGDEHLSADVYWARFARQYGKSKGGGHAVYVCTQRRFHPVTPYLTKNFQDWNNPDIRVPIINPAFNYCDISQNNGSVGQTHYDNIIWYRSKAQQYGIRPINNVKSYHFNWPIGAEWKEREPGTDTEAGARLWRTVFAGGASFRFHRWTQVGLKESATRKGLPGIGLTPLARTHIASMRSFVATVDLFQMAPHDELLSNRTDNEAYCLAEPAKQFAVFFTGEGDRSVTLNLSSAAKPLTLRWLDVAKTRLTKPIVVPRAGGYELSAPTDGHWVAVLAPGGTSKH